MFTVLERNFIQQNIAVFKTILIAVMQSDYLKVLHLNPRDKPIKLTRHLICVYPAAPPLRGNSPRNGS